MRHSRSILPTYRLRFCARRKRHFPHQWPAALYNDAVAIAAQKGTAWSILTVNYDLKSTFVFTYRKFTLPRSSLVEGVWQMCQPNSQNCEECCQHEQHQIFGIIWTLKLTTWTNADCHLVTLEPSVTRWLSKWTNCSNIVPKWRNFAKYGDTDWVGQFYFMFVIRKVATGEADFDKSSISRSADAGDRIIEDLNLNNLIICFALDLVLSQSKVRHLAKVNKCLWVGMPFGQPAQMWHHI